MFEKIYIDVTGGCNAKCPMCVTARTTFGQRIQFMPVDQFEKTLDRLDELELIDPHKTVISLYNWGEPILHPDLNGIVDAAARRNLKIGISTNASKKTTFTNSVSHFDYMTFSVCGWSQSSYDKIHGLRFDRILSNMEATLENMRTQGFDGPFILNFHVYQFNILEELSLAQEWCEKSNVSFQSYAAYINDYEPILQFLNETLPEKSLYDMSQKLFLHYVKDLIAAQPSNWACPQWDRWLTINHKSEVLLCCVVPEGPRDSKLGSIFEMSQGQLLGRKKTNKECTECMSCGAAYWAHNPLFVENRKAPISVGAEPNSIIDVVGGDRVAIQSRRNWASRALERLGIQ